MFPLDNSVFHNIYWLHFRAADITGRPHLLRAIEPGTLLSIYWDISGHIYYMYLPLYLTRGPTVDIITIQTHVLHSMTNSEHDYSSSRIASSEFLSRVPRGRGILT